MNDSATTKGEVQNALLTKIAEKLNGDMTTEDYVSLEKLAGTYRQLADSRRAADC